MTAISGRRCAALLTKSGPLGSLVRTLLESQLWSRGGYSLIWEAKPLYSERVTIFADTNFGNPLPSNASAGTLNISDIPSSRCLFRLRLLELPTEETESSSSPEMWPSPLATDIAHRKRVDELLDAGAETMHSRANGASRPNGLQDYIRFRRMLKTPSTFDAASERMKSWNTSRDTGTLAQQAAMGKLNGLLPTPTCNDATNQTLPPSQGKRNDFIVKRILTGELPTGYNPESDGGDSLLNPLFVEEMMGFPLMWTAYPFLRQNGGGKRSKPTAMR